MARARPVGAGSAYPRRVAESIRKPARRRGECPGPPAQAQGPGRAPDVNSSAELLLN